MATMWPAALPQEILNAPRRKAEVKVFEALAAALDDEFTVFYSSPWLGEDRFGNERDGECDFLIAHPRKGILAIEVKGGGISYDPVKSEWMSTDRDMIRHTIKDPVSQARSAKHEMLKRLKESRHWNIRYISVSHGVILPDAASPPSDLGADRPKRLFCCSSDLDRHLHDWVEERLAAASGGEGTEPLGKDGITALEEILAKPIELKFPLGAKISDASRQISVLTPRQYHIVEMISDIERAVIRGGGGTGKTVIAMEEARRSAEAGRKTLLTCFNRSLSRWMQAKLSGEPNLEIYNFHSLCAELARRTGIELPKTKKDADYFRKTLPEAAQSSLDLAPAMRWDEIIVDEGQDFRSLWWIVLDSALAAGGKLRVFTDSNQQVYDPESGPPGDLEAIPIRLTENLRNTSKIHDAGNRHYEGFPISAVGPEGTDVEWQEVADDKMLAKDIAKRVRTLLNSEECRPDQIAVLVPNRGLVEEVQALLARKNMETTDADHLAEDCVLIDTVRRFKGLEREVVLAGFREQEAGATEYAYVALTRASSHLAVFAPASCITWLES